MSHRITSQPSTALCFCRGASHPHPKLYLEMQENAGAGGGGEGTQLLNASHMVLPNPGCIAKFSGVAGPALAGGAAALGVWGVLLIDGVQQQAGRRPWQVWMPGLLGLLLGGLAETFLLVARWPHVAAVAEVQGPVQSIVNERVEFFEVVVMVAPVAHTHLDA